MTLIERMARAIDTANGCQMESPNWLSLQCAETALAVAREEFASLCERLWDDAEPYSECNGILMCVEAIRKHEVDDASGK